jgi:hypothetical protein
MFEHIISPSRDPLGAGGDAPNEDGRQPHREPLTPILANKQPASLGVVKKPVEAVLMRPVKGKVTLQARRFFNVLLRFAQANGTPAPGQYYRIPLPTFLQDAVFESRNIAYVLDVLNGMMSTVVNWGDTPEKFKGTKANWKGATLLAFAELDKAPTGSTLVFDLHPELRKQFSASEPFAYAKVSLELNAALSSHASLALYELGERYLTSPGGTSKKDHWRSWVAPLTGNPLLVDTTEYKYFYRDVVKPAIAEVNASQKKFIISLIVEKVHRKVETLQFEVRRCVNDRPAEPPAPLAGIAVACLPLVGRMLQWGIRQATAEDLLRAHGPVRIQRALEYTQDRLEKIKSPGAYLKKILSSVEFDNVLVPVPHTAPPTVDNVPTSRPVSQSLMSAFIAAKKQEARKVFEECSAADRANLFQEFEVERLPKCGELYRQRWNEFIVASPNSRPPPFLEHPFLEWLSKSNSHANPDEVLQWGIGTGLVQFRLTEETE